MGNTFGRKSEIRLRSMRHTYPPGVTPGAPVLILPHTPSAEPTMVRTTGKLSGAEHSDPLPQC